MKKILLILLALSFNFVLNAQQWSCQTEEPSVDFLSELNITSYNSAYTAKNINIFVHVIRNSQGTGGLSQTQIDNALELMSQDFMDANICFTQIGSDFIDNDTYYNFQSSLFNSLISVNPHSNAIDVYLLAPNTSSYGGRASGIPGNALVLGANYAGTSVLSHEMGHCLGLYHTHSGRGCGDFANCSEALDGSNCSTCGDMVCDTPADPCLSGQVTSNCIYVGGSGFTPLTDNIQSYSLPQCMSTFTEGQIARMHTIIENANILQQTLNNNPCLINCPLNLSLVNPIFNNQNHSAQNWILGQSNNIIQSTADVTYDAGNYIRLEPGFRAIQGCNFHAFIDGCTASTNFTNNSAYKSNNEYSILDKELNVNIYPNPTKEFATIEYQLPQEANISIALYNGMGQNIASLTNKQVQEAGLHQLQLNVNEFASGVYYIKIKSDVYSSSKKLIIAK